MLRTIRNTLFNRYAHVWKEFIWIGLGQAVAVAGSLVGVRVLTQYLPPAIYGEVALALTGGLLLQNIFMGPCCNALQRFYAPAKDQKRITNYLRAGRRLFLEATAASLVIALVVSAALSVYGRFDWVELVGAASLFSLISGSSSVMDAIQLAARQRRIVAWHQGLGQWMRFSSVVFGVLLFGRSSLVALLGYCLGATIVLVSQALFFGPIFQVARAEAYQPSAGEEYRLVGQMRAYSWPFLAWGIFAWVQFSADRWALGVSGTVEDVGHYAVLAQLGLSPITMLSGLLAQLISPILYDRIGAGTDQARVVHALELNRRLFYGVLMLTIACVAAMFFCHGAIFSWLTAPNYWKVSYLLPWISLAAGLFRRHRFSAFHFSASLTHAFNFGPRSAPPLLQRFYFSPSLRDMGLMGWFCQSPRRTHLCDMDILSNNHSCLQKD